MAQHGVKSYSASHATGECTSCTIVMVMRHRLQYRSMWLACRYPPFALPCQSFGIFRCLSSRLLYASFEYAHHLKLTQVCRLLLLSKYCPSACVQKGVPTVNSEHGARREKQVMVEGQERDPNQCLKQSSDAITTFVQAAFLKGMSIVSVHSSNVKTLVISYLRLAGCDRCIPDAPEQQALAIMISLSWTAHFHV